MSSTNVHSMNEEIDNPCLAGGQTISDKKGNLEIPPRAAKEGPSIMEVKEGQIMEITADNTELREDGKLIKNGEVDAIFGKEAYAKLANKNKSRGTEETAKGEDR